MTIFKLPSHVKTRIINGREFDAEGELHIESDIEADLLAKILVPFYGCEIVSKAGTAEDGNTETADSSLTASVTKPVDKK